MDARTLREVMGGSLSAERYAALCPAFNAAMIAAGCTTVKRAAQWCAQLGHESAGLRYMREIWGPTAQQRKYDPASGSTLSRTLGNDRRGDGERYMGHGPIQITGKANHRSVSRWAFERGLVPSRDYFVERPDELASDRYGFTGAVWYWIAARPRINAMADAGDTVGVTRAINGGEHGLADRKARYERARRLGDRILPSGVAPGTPASKPIVARKRLVPVPEEAIEPMRLPATPVPNGFDPNADPRQWPEIVQVVPFDMAGGWLGECAIAIGFEEVPGRTRDKVAGFLRLASWLLDPPAGGGDVVYRAVDTRLTDRGGGAPLMRHWQTPPYVAPKGARGIVLNYRAPAGGFVAIGRNPAPR